MTRQTATKAPNFVTDQIAAGIVQAFNDTREIKLGLARDKVQAAFGAAINEVENVVGYLRDPSGQLGNPQTKHGEIAEVVEVGIRRAHDCLNEVEMSAHMEGVARTGPVDYILNGVAAQSKFINGTAAGLRGVVGHMNQNAAFVDGGGIYVIPKDQYDKIDRVLRGDTNGISSKTVRTIQKRIQEITERTGRRPLDVLKPSISAYSDVQPGNIENTMNQHQENLEQHHEERNVEIREAHQASLNEGLKATAAAAAVGATISFASAAFKKYKEGKNIFRGEFNAQDWRDVGGEAAMGAAGGALSGAAVYRMTNCAELSAPLAGAFVSAARGMKPLVASYLRGAITRTELIDVGLFVCSDVALVGICTSAGQTLIPVPVLGAMVGSLAGKCLSSLLKSQLNGVSKAIQKRLDFFLNNLDANQRKLIAELDARYDALGDLAMRAFDLGANSKLLKLSAELADSHGVPTHLVLRNESDLDHFMHS